MSALASLQREVLDAVYGDASVEGGLAVYRGNAMANLHDALAATYPVVVRLVGDAFFAEAALQFVRAHPSASGDLAEYGASLASFLAAYPHARSLHYLADVARLEWACHESAGAAEAPILDPTELARVPAEAHPGIRFELHPSARVVRSAHPIVSIWLANQPGEDGTPAASAAEDALVIRTRGALRVSRLEAFEAGLLEALGRGETLAAATAAFGAPLLERALGPALARHARDGVLCGLRAPRKDA